MVTLAGETTIFVSFLFPLPIGFLAKGKDKLLSKLFPFGVETPILRGNRRTGKQTMFSDEKLSEGILPHPHQCQMRTLRVDIFHCFFIIFIHLQPN